MKNHKFIDTFVEWSHKAESIYNNLKISILDDGSTDNDNRLGAVSDIAFAINECNLVESECDGIFVMAGDNLLDF